jgi:hypothetical protein
LFFQPGPFTAKAVNNGSQMNEEKTPVALAVIAAVILMAIVILAV